jgi:hypothetical protein
VSALIALLSREPLVTAKFAGALLGVLGVFVPALDLDADQRTAILTFIAAGFAFHAVVVRGVTVAPATVAAKVTEAATATAERLAPETVGVTGELTADAGAVVEGVVDEVTRSVGGYAGDLTVAAAAASGSSGPPAAPPPG